ncbi:hypothetical protein AtubIFM55763_006508 [Aspergillus tubingensis]|uniref:Major facilitator superfamily (MFS) profile domain-containing protein n=1 Tax=Aspergillus tubingensis TaxID=5068 RepID=A0A9W6ADH7_ASPTU|nr:hypothetical protein AtubIFM54640_009180 [Aspergillus tubingensis]GLA75240.1 hypothetical protein AtubIFM55763_006508 [Aspergillus tubingensis]GLA79217.1 hypothetical protein AtubIFM56815_000003 [Aspergillus tubingensis]
MNSSEVDSSYGVFLAYFTSQSTFPGSRTLDYAFIGGLSASQALFISPLVTVLHRRIGLKATMALGVLLETAAFLGASWSNQIWQLYLSQGVCFGWGLGMQYLSTTYLIPQWFNRHRSLAAGIATGGSGTGGLIYSLSTHALLARFGLGWSYRILAICQLVVNAICLLVIRDRKAVAAPNRSFYINFRLCIRYEMWLYLGWSFFSVMGFMVIWFSLATYGRSVGLTSSQGSIVTAVMNVGQMVGRPAVGFMSDAVGRINIATFATLSSGLLCLFLWTFARTYAALICFALFAGVFFGTFWTVVGPLGAEVVALEDLQSGLTIMWLVCSVPATCERLFPLCPTSFSTKMSKDNEILIRSSITVGEAIGLELRTSGRHEFLHTQLFTGFMYIGAALCLVMLRGWKIGQVRKGQQQQEGITTACPSNSKYLDFVAATPKV